MIRLSPIPTSASWSFPWFICVCCKSIWYLTEMFLSCALNSGQSMALNRVWLDHSKVLEQRRWRLNVSAAATAAHQAPLSLGFSRQEHWSGLAFPSPMHESEKWKWSCSVASNPQRPHRLQPTRLLRPWEFSGKSTGVACHCLLRSYILGSLK